MKKSGLVVPTMAPMKPSVGSRLSPSKMDNLPTLGEEEIPFSPEEKSK